MSDFPSQKQDKFVLRLPDGMRERLKDIAAQNKRSMNAEIVQALEFHLSSEEYATELDKAREQWLSDPDFAPQDYPELTNPELPATKGDIERILLAFEKAINAKASSQ